MKNNLKIALWFLILVNALFFSTAVVEVNVSHQPFFETTFAETIQACYYVNGVKSNDTNMTLFYENNSATTLNYSFSFIVDKNCFEISLISNNESKTGFRASARNLTIGAQAEITGKNGTMDFRQTFNITLNFFKTPTGNVSETFNSAEPYTDNEFQFVYLSFESNSTKVERNLNYLNGKWFNWIPFFKRTKFKSTTEDKNVYFWDKLSSSGTATIKAYTNASYTVFILSEEVVFANNLFFDEFKKPKTSNLNFDARVGYLDIFNETNQAYNIYLTSWEVNNMGVFWNWFKWFMIIMLWITISSLSAILFPQMAIGTAIIATVFYWMITKALGLW